LSRIAAYDMLRVLNASGGRLPMADPDMVMRTRPLMVPPRSFPGIAILPV
jgi:hypothetical protein